MGGDLVVDVSETDLGEVEIRGPLRKNRTNRLVKEQGSRKDSAVEELGPMADRALQRVEFLVGTSLVEVVHQVQLPYCAYRDKQHVLERRLGLARRLE